MVNTKWGKMVMKVQQKNPTTVSSWALAVVQALKSYEIEPEGVLKKAKINMEILRNQDTRIRVVDMSRLWKLSRDITGDSCFGLSVATKSRPTTFHALGISILTSYSLDDVFTRLKRYSKAVSDAIECKTVDLGDDIALSFDPHDNGPRPSDESFDALMAIAADFFGLSTDNDIKLSKIEFMRKEPNDSEPFRKIFKVPLVFSASHNRIHIDKSDLIKPFLTANPEIARQNDQIIAEYLYRFDKSGIGQQVYAKLIEMLPLGEPSLAKIAVAIGISMRSLSRYLRNENTTYREILIETRQYLAIEYLKQSHLSITDVAFRLGYAESSNFTRAFRRWFGCSPSEYRAQRNISGA